jgi:hypothetical protein
MCDYLGDDRSDVWHETTVRARVAHRCDEECGIPIAIGQVHVRVNSLYCGSWSTLRVHSSCYDLHKFIQFDICRRADIVVGGTPLRDRVREHLPESPGLALRYRAAIRAAEGVVR